MVPYLKEKEGEDEEEEERPTKPASPNDRETEDAYGSSLLGGPVCASQQEGSDHACV